MTGGDGFPRAGGPGYRAGDFGDVLWCAIPSFNNGGTVRSVVERALEQCRNIVVVDDGSRDGSIRELLAGLPVEVLVHETNRGKGRAILTALEHVRAKGGKIMITLDADGQHDPADIAAFLPVLAECPEALVVGHRDMEGANVPGKSRFGRAFSDFWVRLESGQPIEDTQSGFRAYPVEPIAGLKFRGGRYDFEVEVIVRAAWKGVPLRNVDITVWYPPAGERVSSFRPFMDNLLFTHRHVLLVCERCWRTVRALFSAGCPGRRGRAPATGS